MYTFNLNLFLSINLASILPMANKLCLLSYPKINENVVHLLHFIHNAIYG